MGRAWVLGMGPAQDTFQMRVDDEEHQEEANETHARTGETWSNVHQGFLEVLFNLSNPGNRKNIAGLLLYKLLMEPGVSSGKDDEIAARIQLGYVKRHFMRPTGRL